MHRSAPTRLVAPVTRDSARRVALTRAAMVALGLAVSLPRLAHADAAIEAATAKELTKPAQRRSGFVLGFGVGAGIAGASGYPNDSAKIGAPAYYNGSDVMGGGGFTLFGMYSLSDWLSFGGFYSRANFRSADWYSFGGGGGVRVDIFPLFWVSPWLRDLAVTGKFGIGTSTLAPTSNAHEGASGTESFLGGGAFYEFFLGKAMGGHWAAGPTFDYDAEVTQSNQRYGALFGGRVAFYTGR